MLSFRGLYYKGCARSEQACSAISLGRIAHVHFNPHTRNRGLDRLGLGRSIPHGGIGRLQVNGFSQVESFVLDQKPEVLQAWVQPLRARFPQGKVALALEQSRGALMNYDFLGLYPVPPRSLALYRQAFYPSGSKDDPVDADLLLDPALRDTTTACVPGFPMMLSPARFVCWSNTAAN